MAGDIIVSVNSTQRGCTGAVLDMTEFTLVEIVGGVNQESNCKCQLLEVI